MSALEQGQDATMTELAAATALYVRVLECDSASSNKCIVATLARQLPPRTVMWVSYCLLHQAHIISGNAVRLAVDRGKKALSHVSAMYCTAMLLRTPGYFLKFLENIDQVLAECIDIRDGAPPLEARQFNLSILDSVGAPRHPVYSALLDVLNGSWWEVDCIPHYCVGESCCHSRQHTVDRIRDTLILTVFARTADVPMPARWTKVVTSLNWFVFEFALHNVLSRVFEASFDPLRRKKAGHFIPPPCRPTGHSPKLAGCQIFTHTHTHNLFETTN